MTRVSKAAGGPLQGGASASAFVQAPPPHLLLPECCDYGSVTTLDWVLVTDRAHLNLSLSASPSAEPGKTKDTGYMWAE